LIDRSMSFNASSINHRSISGLIDQSTIDQRA
jgi:hypothetical protein